MWAGEYHPSFHNYQVAEALGNRIYMTEDGRVVVEGSFTTLARNLAVYDEYNSNYHKTTNHSKKEVKNFIGDLLAIHGKACKDANARPHTANTWKEYYSTAQSMYETMAASELAVAADRDAALHSDAEQENLQTGWFGDESWKRHENQVQQHFQA